MKTTFSLALLATLLLVSVAFGEQPCCWIDAKTGKPVPTKPMGGMHEERTAGTGKVYPADDVHMGPGPDHAFNTKTGQNYVRETNGCWIDAKTGKPVPTKPMGGMHEERTAGTGKVYPADDVHMGPGPDHAFNTKTGQNYVREPCPPPRQATGDTLKKVFESVNIGIGIGGGHTVRRDDHERGRTSTIQKSKTVSAGCKCHPCTCSACNCH